MAAGSGAVDAGAAVEQRPGCAYGLFGLFALFGLVFAGFGLAPMLELWRARSWPPTPCTILTSEVEEVHGDDSTTWRVAVTFRYEVGGVEHVSDRYRVSRISSSGRRSKRRVVDALPPGASATCYVDPADPTRAVLRRDLGEEWIFAAMGLVFSGIGVAGIVHTRRRKHRKRERAARLAVTGVDLDLPAPTASTAALREAKDENGPLALTSGSRHSAKVVFMAVFATIWNGVSWPLLGPELLQLLRGDLRALLPGLMAPVFLLVGLGALLYLGYLLLAWTNPRPTLSLSTALLRPGSRAEVAWQLQGSRRRLEDLTLSLEGRTVTTSGQGDEQRTRIEVFHSSPVAETGRASRILDGKAELSVPADARPSRESQVRATQWVLIVKGTIRGWPDLREEYLLWVHPRAGGT